MKITKFWADNFKGLVGHHDFDVVDGNVNLITADNNGVGKTTIFYAFYCLLVDYVSGSIKDDSINWDSDKMSCGINFTHENKSFIIQVDQARGKSLEKTLSIGDEEFSGASVINKKLKEYFDPSLFLNATAIFQGSKNFTSIKDSERRDNLKKVFNIDYKDAIKNLDLEQKKFVKEKLAVAKQDLSLLQDKEFVEDDVLPYGEVTELNLKDYSINLDNQKKQATDIEIKIATAEQTNISKKAIKKNIDDTQKDLNDAEAKKKTLGTSIESLENYEDDNKELDFLQTNLASKIITRIKTFDDTLLQESKDTLSTQKANLTVANKSFDACKNGVCPTCGTEFPKADIEGARIAVDTILEDITKTKDIIAGYEKQKTEYDIKKKANDDIVQQKEILNLKITTEKKAIERKRQENVDSLKTKTVEYNDLVSKVKELKDKLQGYKVQDAELPEEIIIENEVTNKASIQAEIIRLEKAIKEYESIEAKNVIIKQNNEKILVDKKDTEKKIKKLQKDVDNYEAKKVQFSKMKTFLKNEFPSYVISSMIEQIQDNMNEFISKVYYKDLDVVIDGTDDSIKVLYGTGKVKVDTVNASGAEEALLALSYCYSLNLLKHYDILFIDEVDQAFTEDNSQKLAEIIVSSKDIYDNLFAISHVKNTKDYYASTGANIINLSA